MRAVTVVLTVQTSLMAVIVAITMTVRGQMGMTVDVTGPRLVTVTDMPILLRRKDSYLLVVVTPSLTGVIIYLKTVTVPHLSNQNVLQMI